MGVQNSSGREKKVSLSLLFISYSLASSSVEMGGHLHSSLYWKSIEGQITTAIFFSKNRRRRLSQKGQKKELGRFSSLLIHFCVQFIDLWLVGPRG